MADLERIRLVILGGAGVGKSCIVKRFLFQTYSDKYRATVEDLYNREYDLGGGVVLKVIISVILRTLELYISSVSFLNVHSLCNIIALNLVQSEFDKDAEDWTKHLNWLFNCLCCMTIQID